MFETTSYGAVLPSYDIETLVEGMGRWSHMRIYAHLALGFNFFFMSLEVIEVLNDGPAKYFGDMWNLMDWLNFGLCILMWVTIRSLHISHAERGCPHMCSTIGYCDDFLVMSTYRTAKMFLSFCVCIQILKVVKFTDKMIPKMNLATSVLYQARGELIFFTFVFVISMLAFSQLFYIELGPFMDGFNTQTGALLSLTRALFGDFDIDEILDDSKDYLNAIFFLTYLFVAIFIMLSMFLAILGEAQGKVRQQKDAAEADGTMPPQYGVFSELYDTYQWVSDRARGGDGGGDGDGDGKDKDSAESESEALKSVMRKERQNEPARRRDVERMHRNLISEMQILVADMGGGGAEAGAEPSHWDGRDADDEGRGARTASAVPVAANVSRLSTAASAASLSSALAAEARVIDAVERTIETKLLPRLLQQVDARLALTAGLNSSMPTPAATPTRPGILRANSMQPSPSVGSLPLRANGSMLDADGVGFSKQGARHIRRNTRRAGSLIDGPSAAEEVPPQPVPLPDEALTSSTPIVMSTAGARVVGPFEAPQPAAEGNDDPDMQI